ncbi:MAG: hypothetical protein ACR2QW_17595 [bacterium]
MKKRILYVLMFAVPAVLTAALASIAIFGVVAGALWIFVLGDDPWPAFADTGLAVVTLIVFMTVMVTLLGIAYRAGRNQEIHSTFNSKHLALSMGTTVALLGLIVTHQYSVGSFGTPSDSVLCAEYCHDRGFSASSMTPRTSGLRQCGCLDSQGVEVIRLPFDGILVHKKP